MGEQLERATEPFWRFGDGVLQRVDPAPRRYCFWKRFAKGRFQSWQPIHDPETHAIHVELATPQLREYRPPRIRIVLRSRLDREHRIAVSFVEPENDEARLFLRRSSALDAEVGAVDKERPVALLPERPGEKLKGLLSHDVERVRYSIPPHFHADNTLRHHRKRALREARQMQYRHILLQPWIDLLFSGDHAALEPSPTILRHP